MNYIYERDAELIAINPRIDEITKKLIYQVDFGIHIKDDDDADNSRAAAAIIYITKEAGHLYQVGSKWIISINDTDGSISIKPIIDKKAVIKK